ncbi:MAG: hypothetical protein P8J37_10275 [Fuerstiella sp.]|jgi:hypothetical protein|nr:hypothetical protein [Fuerstiella sp.]
MSDERRTLDSLMSHLRMERDELKLKVHLAELDAKDEYARLSEKFDELTVQYDPIKNAVAESAENVVAALRLAAGEMSNGFQQIRKAIKEK